MATKHPKHRDSLHKRNSLAAAAAEAALDPRAETVRFLAAFYQKDEICVKGFTEIGEADEFFSEQHISREDRVIVELDHDRKNILVS